MALHIRWNDILWVFVNLYKCVCTNVLEMICATFCFNWILICNLICLAMFSKYIMSREMIGDPVSLLMIHCYSSIIIGILISLNFIGLFWGVVCEHKVAIKPLSTMTFQIWSSCKYFRYCVRDCVCCRIPPGNFGHFNCRSVIQVLVLLHNNNNNSINNNHGMWHCHVWFSKFISYGHYLSMSALWDLVYMPIHFSFDSYFTWV